MTTRGTGEGYAKDITNEYPIGTWFRNEDIRHLIPLDQNVSRTLAQMTITGYVEKKSVKRIDTNHVIYKWRVVSLVATKKRPHAKHGIQIKTVYVMPSCALAEILGMVPVDHKLPRIARQLCCGAGHGSGLRHGSNPWSRVGEL